MTKKRILWLVRIGITLGLFGLLLSRIDVNELWREVQRADPAWLVVAFLAQGLAIVCNVARWDVLLKGQGLRLPMRHLASTFLIGRFFGTFLPSTVGLDAYRAYDTAVYTGDVTRSVAVIVVEKIIGFFALCGLILLTLAGGASLVSQAMLVTLGILFALPVMISFALLLRPAALQRLLDLPFPGKRRLERPLRNAVEAVGRYHDQPRRLWTAVAFGVAVHAFTVLMYYAIAIALGAGVTASQMLFAGPLIIASTVGLPTIGGEGARELTSMALLTGLVGDSKAFLIAHLGFWINLSYSLMGGVVYLLRPAGSRPKIGRPADLKVEATTAAVPLPPHGEAVGS